MVKLLICFSLVNDTNDVVRSDWEKASKEYFNIDYTRMIINPYDESAIEYALRYKEAAAISGTEVHLTAMTVGHHLKDTIYRNLFAVGIDRIVLLKNRNHISFGPVAISKVIKEFIDKDHFDSIFMGHQNIITRNGQTGARLSVYLGLPYIGYIMDMEFMDGKLRIKCKTRLGFQTAIVKPGAVFSFHDTIHPYLRVATLKEKLASSKKQVEEYELNPIAEEDDQPYLESLYYEPMVRKCRMIEGKSSEERARLLLRTYLQCGGA